MDLRDMGFMKGDIVECIITTNNEDGSVNAAPMGVHYLENDKLMIKVHQQSDTFTNISREKKFIVNIIFEPILFLKTALKGENKGSKEMELENKNFISIEDSGQSFLKNASAYLSIEVEEIKNYDRTDNLGTAEWSNIPGKVVSIQVIKAFPRGYNRGLGAGVELAVDISRGKLDNIDKYKGIMKKTMSSEDFREIELFLESLGY